MKKAKNFIEHIIDEDLRNGFDKNKPGLDFRQNQTAIFISDM